MGRSFLCWPPLRYSKSSAARCLVKKTFGFSFSVAECRQRTQCASPSIPNLLEPAARDISNPI